MDGSHRVLPVRTSNIAGSAGVDLVLCSLLDIVDSVRRYIYSEDG